MADARAADRFPSLVCPRCRGSVIPLTNGVSCRGCGAEYKLDRGVLHLVEGRAGPPGFDPHYFGPLREVEDRHFWFAARQRVILDALRRTLPDLGDRALFDIGCGSGGLLAYLGENGVPVSGACDAYVESLEMVRTRVAAPLVLVDEGRLPPLGPGQTLLSLFDVLEHLDDDMATLRFLWSVLDPGGALVITVPAHPFLFDEMDVLAHHRRRYRLPELREKLEASGFEVRTSFHFMAPLVPLLVLGRTLGRLLGKGKAGASGRRATELSIVPGINGVLGALLAVERRGLRRDWSLPFGSSILAVAVRLDSRPLGAGSHGGAELGAPDSKPEISSASLENDPVGTRDARVETAVPRRAVDTREAPSAHGSRLSGLGILLALLFVFASQYSHVRPTNFGGTDEWLYVDLASRGVLSIPYAHRPLVLLWTAPAALLWPDNLWAYYVTHGLWLLFGAWTLALILRRLVPEVPALAFLAGVICLVWAPEDFLRLDTVLLTGYSGFTLGALLAVLLFLESYSHRSIPLFVLASAIGALTARGFEGTMPLMGTAPLLLLWRERNLTRRFWTYFVSWTALMATLSVVIAVDFLGSGGGAYQGSALTLDPDPRRVVVRILEQFGYHLLPLFRGPFLKGVWTVSLLSALSFLLAYGSLMRRRNIASGRRERRLLAEVTVVGLLMGAVGYFPLMLSASIVRAARTQFLSAPGIGVFLAAFILLVASLVPWKRGFVAALLTSFVVAAGAGRLLGMQAEWDEWRSKYPAQHRALTGLVALAPRVVPRTLFLLLDEADAWPATFPFRHAVQYLYGGEASGHVVGVSDFLYPLYPVAGGFVSAPWPTIRGPWAEPVRFYRYGEIVVVRDSGIGGMKLVEEWPAAALGALPPDAAYAPRARLLEPGEAPPSRRILLMKP